MSFGTRAWGRTPPSIHPGEVNGTDTPSPSVDYHFAAPSDQRINLEKTEQLTPFLPDSSGLSAVTPVPPERKRLVIGKVCSQHPAGKVSSLHPSHRQLGSLLHNALPYCGSPGRASAPLGLCPSCPSLRHHRRRFGACRKHPAGLLRPVRKTGKCLRQARWAQC